MNPHVVTELLQSAAATVAVGRLIQVGPTSRVKAVIAYLAFIAVSGIVYGLLSPRSAPYFWFYIVAGPCESVLSILAVRELLALVFDAYPGIETAGRWAMYTGVAIATVASLALAAIFWRGGAAGHPLSHLIYFQVWQRSVTFGLAIVIATIVFFLSKYPLHLRRNIQLSSAFFSVLFLSEALRQLIDSLAPQLYNHYVDRSESIFIALCLGSWAVLLRPETGQAPARVKFSTPQEDHLLKQLESLNQLMGRAARR
jgi:hypothetical protein